MSQESQSHPWSKFGRLIVLSAMVACFLAFLPEADAATNVYYSVGQNTNDHKTGSPTMDISNGTATFSVAQTATNMGVGDNVTYNTTSVAYISAKLSGTQWTLVTATGGTPSNVTGATVNSISHEFSSLQSAVGSAVTGNATSASHLNTSNLVTGNYVLNIPLYYDSGADTTIVVISGYTTGASNPINIYTPTNTSTEVNQSQRHAGTWDDTKYAMATSSTPILSLAQSYVHVTGVQFNALNTTQSQTGIQLNGGVDGNRVSNNIIKFATHSGGSVTGITVANSNSKSIYIFNNLLYNLNVAGSSAARGISDTSSTGAFMYIYNNTVNACTSGTSSTTPITVTGTAGRAIAKNNLIRNCNEGIYGIFSSGTDYNANASTSLNYTVTGGGNTHDRINQTFTFVDSANNDFHLTSSDAGAKDRGVDLSADANLAFSTDIDGQTRSGTWDIGADEYVDVTAPVISSVASSTTSTTATITWTTDESATSTVNYGLTASYGTASTSASLVTSHSIGLTGLSPGTLYHFQVSSADASNNVTNSSDNSFTTTDTTAPTVSLTSPTNGATVTGSSVTISANASDDVAVAGVQFKVDTNTNIGSEDTTSAYSVVWDSTGVADGSHSIIAVARDGSANYATSSPFTITVDNTAPARSNGAPSSSQTSSSVTLSLTTNESSTCKYGTIANTAYASIANTFTTTGGTSHSVALTGLTNGSYSYYVRCQDSVGNSNISDFTISFSVAQASASSSVAVASGNGAPGAIAIVPNIPLPRPQIVYPDGRITYLDTPKNEPALPNQTQESTTTPYPSLLALTKGQRAVHYTSSNEGIRELQMFLNARGYLVAASGPGSLGRETNYFGASTKAALTRFQETYRDDILRPLGLNHATGVLGPRTLRKIEQLLQR